MSKREYALASMRIAGYHEDQRARVRLLVEHRISRAKFDEAWVAGIKQRKGGMVCNCIYCKEKTET